MGRNNCIINLNNLKYNLRQIKNHTNKQIMAVVKANAYGHGAVEVSKALGDEVNYLAVACIEEALEIRLAGIELPILILGHTDSEDFNKASRMNITVAIHDLKDLDNIEINEILKVHLKINTGMNRIGLSKIEDINSAIEIINDNKHIYLEGIFTHYATSDCDPDYYIYQHNKFKQIFDSINYKFDYIHTSNSAASINYEEEFANMVRPGKILYGLKPNCNICFDIKPVLSLSSSVVEVKKINAGERVGYSNFYTANEDMIIATIPIGYGDGWLRRNRVVPVYINNKYYPIVGLICMDMLMIQVDDNVKVGDEVELIGPHVTASYIAKKIDTISYEVVCSLGKRLKRKYINN